MKRSTIYLPDSTRVIDMISNVHELGGSVRTEHGYLIATINGGDSLLDTYPDSTFTKPTH